MTLTNGGQRARLGVGDPESVPGDEVPRARAPPPPGLPSGSFYAPLPPEAGYPTSSAPLSLLPPTVSTRRWRGRPYSPGELADLSLVRTPAYSLDEKTRLFTLSQCMPPENSTSASTPFESLLR